MKLNRQRVVGVIPAAGRAKRIAPLPMSKELFPLGFTASGGGSLRPKVASQYLLERLSSCGVREAYFVLRPGKWDIPGYFGDGMSVGMKLAYLTVHVSLGVPFTLDQAYPFVHDHCVALGFPDILFWPEDAFGTVFGRLRESNADVVLGLFPTDEPSMVGLVEVDDQGEVGGIFEKSGRTDLPYMWAIAVWKPTFTEFLHLYVQNALQALTCDSIPKGPDASAAITETPIGDVIHAALSAGLRIEAEVFQDGSYIDIGTPDNLRRAILQEQGKR